MPTKPDPPYAGFGTPITATDSETPIYAKFEKVFYIVYQDTDGQVITSQRLASGASYTFDPDFPLFPKGPHAINTGWKDQNGTVYKDETINMTQDLTLTAQLQQGIHVHFFSQGGSPVESKFVMPGAEG